MRMGSDRRMVVRGGEAKDVLSFYLFNLAFRLEKKVAKQFILLNIRLYFEILDALLQEILIKYIFKSVCRK